MTLLHLDSEPSKTKTIVSLDVLAGKDLSDPKEDLILLEKLLIILFQAYKLNTRIATDSANNVTRAILKEQLPNDGFLINLSFEIVLGFEASISHLMISKVNFSLAEPS